MLQRYSDYFPFGSASLSGTKKPAEPASSFNQLFSSYSTSEMEAVERFESLSGRHLLSSDRLYS